MVKWWNFCNRDLLKCKNVLVLFSYPRVILSLPFRSTLTGLGGGCPRQFLLHICTSYPLHLHIRLPLPFTCHICPPREPLSLYLPFPLPHNISPPRAPISIPLALPCHLGTHCAPLSISIPLHIIWPPCLSQHFTRCHSYTKMSQIIQCI